MNSDLTPASAADAATHVGVLVVDDSALMQRIISRLLESDPQITVVGTAADGLEAVEKVAALRPDVVTLDIEMPRMDGLAALKRIMAVSPTPVVMLSALGEADMVMAALEAGAVEFVTKPSGTVSVDLYKVGAELIRKVKVATFARRPMVRPAAGTKATPDTRPPWDGLPVPSGRETWCAALGASTGGPGAITQILNAIPASFPGVLLIVQHMPVGFTRSFTARLDREVTLKVLEAEDGARPAPGSVYVASGGRHMRLERDARGLVIVLDDSPPVNSVRPSIDVLMASVAETCGAESVGVLLTGMGRDGAAGLAKIKAAGGATLVQDRASSTIFGMPRVAIRMGVVDQVLPITQVAPALMSLLEARLRGDD